MSVLHPEIVVIGKRRYRRNPFRLAFQSNEGEANRPYEEETDDMFLEDHRQHDSKPLTDQTDEDEPSCATATDANRYGSGEGDSSNRKQDEYDYDYDDIDQSKDGTFRVIFSKYHCRQCSIRADESYYGFIIGKGAEKKMRMEQETATRIKIPSRNDKGGADKTGRFILVEGLSKKSVASCRNRIWLLINAARLQKPFTHLLTFPLSQFASLKTKYAEFTTQVLAKCSRDRGVDQSIFLNANKLHLTICVVTLVGSDEIEDAVTLLDECRRTFVKELLASGPVVAADESKRTRAPVVHIRGLEYMNDDPARVDVLYAKVVDTTNVVQRIADKLLAKFVDAGLAQKQYDRVKLHATVMNSLKRRDLEDDEQKVNSSDSSSRSSNNNNRENNGERKIERDRESFDARNILAQFGQFDFGSYALDQIHLSIRFTAGFDGYYDYVSNITL